MSGTKTVRQLGRCVWHEDGKAVGALCLAQKKVRQVGRCVWHRRRQGRWGVVSGTEEGKAGGALCLTYILI